MLRTANDDPTYVDEILTSSPYDLTRPIQPGTFLEMRASRGEVLFPLWPPDKACGVMIIKGKK